MDLRHKLESCLNHLNEKIREAEDRLGAHSIKPVLMQQLFDLEEERDAVMAQLDALRQDQQASGQ